MFPKFCGIGYFVNYFYDRTKAIFFGEDILLTEYYIGCHSVGENMECFDSCRQ